MATPKKKNDIRSHGPLAAGCLALGLAVLAGFWVRAALVSHGDFFFSSDEALSRDRIAARLDPSQASDYLSDLDFARGPRFLLCMACGFLSGARPSHMSVWFCLVNVLLYLGAAGVIFWRHRANWKAAVPMLAFLAVPAACVAYLGTQASEVRSFYFYGLLLMAFAGRWFENRWAAFFFGLLAVKGGLDDPFTAFFAWAVMVYERERIGELFSRKKAAVGAAWATGALIGWALDASRPFYMKDQGPNYFHWGLASVTDWVWHAKMLVEAWPLYWTAELPLGYVQQSRLGILLRPPLPGGSVWIPLVFWALFAATAAGAFRALPRPRWPETVLWAGPFFTFMAFFVLGAQSWDALTLRYLGFGQLIPALWLGIWAFHRRQRGQWKGWALLLALWTLFNGFFLVKDLVGPPLDHPARRIALDLKASGIRAGFSNYWVSESVRYFSDDQVELAPYNHPPVSRRATRAAQTSPEIGLVWVEGLDRPQNLPEIVGQLRSLGYRPERRIDLDQGSWSLFVWRKSPGAEGGPGMGTK